ncbi:uncharacterized protein LOC110702586 isoform X1 [Chenopodium quinoa]|uniref:uncharacterized protein LOC110702586 isoform X1 n=1 Tax=Chenopodium quinoa TaxID=63459 RepID=UPI000B7864C0|nr:uncharacterized protein LOC110702586 isoform X1 [Chenopodium quinoa]
MAVTQQPILSRLDRLDNLMRHLENLRGSNRSLKSSSPSTPSSGTRTSDVEFFSPRSLDKLNCRPIDDVIVETEHKGTLLNRVSLIEQRLLKLCMQLEQEMEREKQEKDREEKSSHSHKKAGLKQFVKSCVKGSKNKSNNK